MTPRDCQLVKTAVYITMHRWRTVLVLLCLMYDGCESRQTFVREPSDQYVREGQTILLPCQVQDAVGQVQWTRDEFGLGIGRDLPSYPRYQMIGDDTEGTFSLEIRGATMEDDAVFQCQVGSAQGQQGIRSRDARVTLLIPPETPRILQGSEVSATAGMEFRLECESRGGKPPAEIEWYNGEAGLLDANATLETVSLPDGKRSVVRSTLTLTAGPELDRAQLTCRAHNAALSAPQTAAVGLRVTFAPQVVVAGDERAVDEFEDVTLHCTARANPAQVRYRWRVNSEDLAGEYHSSVTLRSVDRRLNNATVTCHVTNTIGTGSGHTRLSVLYAAQLRSEPRDVTAEVGATVTLVCDVDANPPPHVAWFKQDCPHCPKPVGVGRSISLTASQTTAGSYECRTSGSSSSESHQGSLSRRLRLFLRAAPQVTAPATQRGRTGHLVHLECNVASVPPPTQIIWSYRGHPVLTAGGRRAVVQEDVAGGVRSLLVIPDAKDSDFGLYNCSAANAYGSDHALIILETEDDLPVLLILTIVIGVVIVIATVTLVVVLCQRQRRRDVQTKDTVAFDKSSKTTDPNSSSSDIKVEIRTSSSGSGSGQMITDRWDGPGYPAHGTSYEDHSDVRAFPPFAKDTIPPSGPLLYPPYDSSNYVQRSGTSGHQRALQASTPIELGPTAGPALEPPSVHAVYCPQEAAQTRTYSDQSGSLQHGRPGFTPSHLPGQVLAQDHQRHNYCYAQDVSDASSTSHSRSTLPYDDTSAPGTRTRYMAPLPATAVNSRLPPQPRDGRGVPSAAEYCDGRDYVPAGSMGRHRTADSGGTAEHTRNGSVSYSQDLPALAGNLATPV